MDIPINYYMNMTNTPNWQHNSNKPLKIKLKPQQVRARKEALKALKRKIRAQ